MAGTGPPPSDPETNVRSSEAFESLPIEGYTGPYPELPKSWRTTVTEWVEGEDGAKVEVEKTKHVTYLADTREWYEHFATSPMATKFTKVDWDRLRLVIAPLRDIFHRRPSTKLASEIRLQEAALGATILDRQKMHMRVGQGPLHDAQPVVPPGVADFDAERRKRLTG